MGKLFEAKFFGDRGLVSIQEIAATKARANLAIRRREVMKKPDIRIFGQADWTTYYGRQTERLHPKVEDIFFSPCPFHKGKLVKDTHFAFVGMPAINGTPLTVARWLELHQANSQPNFIDNTGVWYTDQPHVEVATLEPRRLYLVLREIVPGSTNKTPEEQVAMLPPEYEVPSTITEVTKNILVLRRTGKYSNNGHWAVCSDITVRTDRVNAGLVSCVGGSRSKNDGLRVTFSNGDRRHLVGVGASRKIEGPILFL